MKQIKDYLKKRGISAYRLSKDCGIPYSTLNDLINGKVEAEQCRVFIIRKMAEYLGLSMEALLDMLESEQLASKSSYDTDISVSVRNKTYYADFTYNDEPVSIDLCRVNENSTFYIADIARWRTDQYISKRRMEEFE